MIKRILLGFIGYCKSGCLVTLYPLSVHLLLVDKEAVNLVLTSVRSVRQPHCLPFQTSVYMDVTKAFLITSIHLY